MKIFELILCVEYLLILHISAIFYKIFLVCVYVSAERLNSFMFCVHAKSQPSSVQKSFISILTILAASGKNFMKITTDLITQSHNHVIYSMFYQ